MAELAFGAVRSLLGLLREEAQQLTRVGDDVRFIQEEMESMESFLRHLAETTPPSGEHGPPVRTWMKQVRDLAFDCSNCIDLYVRKGRGQLVAHDGGGGRLVALLRSLWSTSFLTALLAQRDAAAQLRQLKVRARDVSERRQRYGVELPGMPGSDAKQLVKSISQALKQQPAFFIQLPMSEKTDNNTDPGSGGTEEAVSVAMGNSKDVGSGGTEVARLSTQTAGDDEGGDHECRARPINIMAVSHDFMRSTLGFSEPNILEENTKKLVELLTGHPKYDNHQEEAAAAKQNRPWHPLDNIIFIAAPDKEDGGGRQALGDPVVSAAFKVTWLQLDFGLLFALLNFYEQILKKGGLWFMLRFLLDDLFPDEASKDMEEKDNWDEAKIAEEISRRKGLKGAASLFVIEGSAASGRLWDLIKEALGKFDCAPGSAAIVIVTDMAHADELRRERGVVASQPLVIHSLVEYWSTKALAVLDRSRLKTDYLRRNMRSILRQIQECCKPQAFCIKMFVHYLCANPNRTKEELDELLVRTLVSTGSLPPDDSDATEIREANGKMLLKFCYNDLPRANQNCLLYLAIFPPGRTIWRSRLVMRWIVEGLIAGRDMRRAVLRAERCFDTLVSRWFVCPADITDAREVRTCTIQHKLIQGLINDGAKEEQFLDPRLSRHLAQHFSVHSNLRLRRSDTIQDFMLNLVKKGRRSMFSPAQLNLIKVIDLEDCTYLKNPVPRKDSKNMRLYLKNICSNMLLLKYLSIRNTDVDKLPKNINNLLHLEILDIRQTRVPYDATKDIMLPKLKCLLAGHTQTTSTRMADKHVPSVQIPRKISAMPNMEVLSHVNASHDADVLKHIGHLWQLRKLGAVINGNLKDWLKAIGDLNECLQSLSIHIEKQSSGDVAQAAEEQHINPDTSFHLELLERLSISGSTSRELLPLFFKDDRHKLIAKVTLRDTLLDHSTLEEHLKKLSGLQRIKLRFKSYTQRELTFNSHVLPKLKFLIVECSTITSIKFHSDAAPKLEKIVWSFTKMESLSGIKNLPVLKELVLKGDGNIIQDQVSKDIADQLSKDIAEHPNFPVLIRNPPQN
ncbi:probable disease resistance protein RXW24L [Setaria italica]|uniref:probable disease resistance protein RXW24L n=1 Tax=Setaria italica TaxID=4555 RepID=UPI000350CCF3|nr:probable disease resistance protein RXW24L [Setaria italica]